MKVAGCAPLTGLRQKFPGCSVHHEMLVVSGGHRVLHLQLKAEHLRASGAGAPQLPCLCAHAKEHHPP